jgi:hypothetical protein
MRVGVVLLLAALIGSAVGHPATAPPTQLSIDVYPNGIGQPGLERYTLRCGPVGGTLPHRGLACLTLARLVDPFAPTPPGTFCTDLAAGPQEAVVRGRVRGARVDTRLSVQGGCEINRWRRVASVVPGFAGP